MNHANDAHVSLYVLDPGGLDSSREDEAERNAINEVAATSRVQRENRPLTRRDFTLSEATEGVPYRNRLNVLRNLAESTGGMLVAETNDLRPGLRQVDEDIHRHYEVSYPMPGADDGSFHRVQLRVQRPHLTVRARSGYYALPSVPQPIFDYELPLYSALSRMPPPADLPIHQQVWLFPGTLDRARVRLTVEMPVLGVTDRTSFGPALDFRFLTLVSDEGGAVVTKFSQQYTMSSLPGDQSLKLEREFSVGPGAYHISSGIEELHSGKAAVRKTALRVLSPAPGALRSSSLVVVDRLEPLKLTDDLSDPLRFGSYRIVPAVSRQWRRRSDKSLVLYFVIYPPSGLAPSAEVRFMRDGQVAGIDKPELPAAAADGSIAALVQLPLSQFLGGSYQAELRVHCGADTVSQFTTFEVVDEK
jgi:hypothetical protein